MRLGTIGALLATVATLALSACGGGGGGGIGGTGATAGVSFGTITGFGSVFVNGVEFKSGSAEIRIDDTLHLESDLRQGMIVRVDGSISGATANAITVDGAIKGRVEQVLDANRMVVMGQTVRIDDQTRFENGIVPVAGEFVEVHGLVVADGIVAAGFIERKTTLPTPPFAVKGLVKSHDTGARTFVLGTLTVSYAGAVTSDMPGGSWNGLQVEVKGLACAGNPVCGTLSSVSKVEPGGLRVADAPNAEVEGFVASGTSASFKLGNQAVVTSGSTRFEGGVAGEITVGVKLEVEGVLSAGVLSATKVSFRDNVRLEGDVASIDVAGGTLTLAGLPGINVKVSSLTEFKNVASLSGLSMPNHLRIRGRSGTGNAVTAMELERRSATSDTRVILQGPVSAFAAPNLTILGRVVDTSSVAFNDFKDINDAPIGSAAFFAGLKAGALVKARGVLGGITTVTWDQMERED